MKVTGILVGDEEEIDSECSFMRTLYSTLPAACSGRGTSTDHWLPSAHTSLAAFDTFHDPSSGRLPIRAKPAPIWVTNSGTTNLRQRLVPCPPNGVPTACLCPEALETGFDVDAARANDDCRARRRM